MSDTHRSDITNLHNRVTKKNYKQYLLELNIIKARGLIRQTVRFEFPVTALIGTNGGGKSTVLGSAALAYKSTKPGDFFPKSNVGDQSMTNWRIEYKVIDQPLSKGSEVSRNARFVSAKWRRDDLLEREVVYFPIKRTVPASEQTKYKRFIGIYEMQRPSIKGLPSDVAVKAGEILAKDLKDYRIARATAKDEEYILLGSQSTNNFSQFHFGAGEASIIEMVMKIEAAPDYSLVLIEEIENGLHPIATEKMVDYLIEVALRKKIQIIFTTHSENALKKLPPNAIWAAIDGKVVQGNLSIASLRAISGTTYKDRVIFVEDEFAKDWVQDIVNQYCSDLTFVAEIHSAGGFPFILEVTKHHNDNKTRIGNAISVLDGDVNETTELPDTAVKLPGEIPEIEIWDYIQKNRVKFSGIIQQRCHALGKSEDQIIHILNKVNNMGGDAHLIFKKLAAELGFLSEIVVRKALISIYNENNFKLIEPICNKIKEIAPLKL